MSDVLVGMDRVSGGALGHSAHIAQSVTDILTTLKGTRVMRRTYGSDLPLLIDAPINDATLVDIFMAIAEPMAIWEPRIRLVRIEVPEVAAGGLHLRMVADELGVGELDLSVYVRRGEAVT